MNPRDIPVKDALDREAWRRSNHDLAILTTGHVGFLTGESLQNVHIMLQGCLTMLTVIGPMFREKAVLGKDDEDGRARTKGIGTQKYQAYISDATRIRKLINASQVVPEADRYFLLQKAYGICYALGMSILQDANDMGFDFRPKIDPTEAYMGSG